MLAQKIIIPAVLFLALPVVCQDRSSGAVQEPGQQTSDSDSVEEQQEREEVSSLLNELGTTLEQIKEAHVQVRNVGRVLDKLDEGAVEATEAELLKANQFMRKELAKNLRELRSHARTVESRVKTVVLPKERGLAAKLRTRWELETDISLKQKIGEMVSEQEQATTETNEQVQQLESRIKSLTGAIQILEGHLSYLDLVEESLGMSKEVAAQLRSLNQEIDKVVQALMEKEMKQ